MRLRRLTELDPSFAQVVRALGLSALVAAGCTASDEPSAGAEGGPCVDNDCLGTLACNAENVCVSADGGSSGAGSSAGSGSSDDDDDDGDSGGGNGGSGDTEGAGCVQGQGEPVEGNAPPEIVDVSVDGSAITSEQDNVRVTVTVSDPDGLDDIVGVRIETPDGGSLKELAQTSSDTFSAEIDWYYDVSYTEDELLGIEVEFQVVARDQGCNAISSALTLLVCEDGESECDGACTNTRSSSENCGECGNPCEQGEYCDYGMCEQDSAAHPEPAPTLHAISAEAEAVSLSFAEATPADAPVNVDAFAL